AFERSARAITRALRVCARKRAAPFPPKISTLNSFFAVPAAPKRFPKKVLRVRARKCEARQERGRGTFPLRRGRAPTPRPHGSCFTHPKEGLMVSPAKADANRRNATHS